MLGRRPPVLIVYLTLSAFAGSTFAAPFSGQRLPGFHPDPGSALARVEEEVRALAAGVSVDAAALDLVAPRNGNLFLHETDLQLPGLTLERAYNSLSSESGTFGQGWSTGLDARLQSDGEGGIALMEPDGHLTT